MGADQAREDRHAAIGLLERQVAFAELVDALADERDFAVDIARPSMREYSWTNARAFSRGRAPLSAIRSPWKPGPQADEARGSRRLGDADAGLAARSSLESPDAFGIESLSLSVLLLGSLGEARADKKKDECEPG